jgi:toxin-antitoxin system PIN domain toxin
VPASLFDTNIWIALTFKAHPLHQPAEAAFLAHSPAEKAFFCRATQQSFLRLLTTQAMVGVYGVPTSTNHRALEIIDQLMASPSVGYVQEPPNVWPTWRRFADLATVSPKRWMDAYLAAVAMESGLRFVTSESAFQSFPGLNPTILVAPAPPAPPSP